MPSIRLKLSTGDAFYKAAGFDPETLSIRRYSLNGNDFYKAEVIDRGLSLQALHRMRAEAA